MLAPVKHLPDLIRLAEAAGAAILEIYRADDFAVRTKGDSSPLTEADERAEGIILEGLAKLAPGVPVIAEEAAARGELPGYDPAGTFFLVDPLDGTKEFVNRRDEFTVNIALVESGEPVTGVILAPALDRLWWGAKGQGASARRNGTARDIAARAAAEPPKAVASRSHRDEQTDAFLRDHGVTDTVSAGSSLKFCLLAEGEADLYPRFGPTMEWDTAAGQAILVAAGGRVETLDGAPFRYGKPGFKNPGFVARGRAG